MDRSVAARRRGALPEGVFLRGRTYWIRWSEGGRQRQKSSGLRVGHPGAVEAAKALRAKKIQEAFDRVHFPSRVDCALGEALDEYILAKSHLKSIKVREAILRDARDFFGNETPVAEITHSRLRAWMGHVASTPGETGRTRGAQTVSNYVATLKAALRTARKAKLTNADPFDSFEFDQKIVRRTRVATDAEIRQLIDRARSEGQKDLADMILVGVETGMRLGKVYTMHWDHLDLEERMYRVPATAGGKSTPVRVPLSKNMVEMLSKRQGRGFVFEQRIEQSSVSANFSNLVKRAGIKDLRFHDLRHTAATRLRRAGVDILTIKAILGHKSMAMHEIYHTVDEADLLAAIDKLEG